MPAVLARSVMTTIKIQSSSTNVIIFSASCACWAGWIGRTIRAPCVVRKSIKTTPAIETDPLHSLFSFINCLIIGKSDSGCRRKRENKGNEVNQCDGF